MQPASLLPLLLAAATAACSSHSHEVADACKLGNNGKTVTVTGTLAIPLDASPCAHTCEVDLADDPDASATRLALFMPVGDAELHLPALDLPDGVAFSHDHRPEWFSFADSDHRHREIGERVTFTGVLAATPAGTCDMAPAEIHGAR